MYQQKSMIYRILSIWTVLSFLPVLFFISPAQEKVRYPLNHFQQEQSLPHPEFNRFVTLICKEEFLPQKTIGIYRSHTPKNLNKFRNFGMFFIRKLRMTATVCILDAVLQMTEKTISYSQKYIIRYIQNQDGRKG